MIQFNIFIILLLIGAAVVVLQLVFIGVSRAVKSKRETKHPVDPDQPNLITTVEEFTEEQKCIMVFVIGLLAKADGPIDFLEEMFIKKMCKLLHLSDTALRRYYQSKGDLWENDEQTMSHIRVILNTLSDDDKDWFVERMDDLVCNNRTPSEVESKMFAEIIHSMGVSSERYMKIVEELEYYRKLTS